MISLRDVVTGFGNRDPLAEVWRRSLRGGGGGSAEITGTLPLRYIGNGKPLTYYMIYGNTVQNGTPSPKAPVDATGSGVRTGNLVRFYQEEMQGSFYGVDVTVKNAEITLNGTVTKGSGHWVEIGYKLGGGTESTDNVVIPCEPETPYTIATEILDGNSTQVRIIAFGTSNENITVNIGSSSTTTFIGDINRIFISLGAEGVVFNNLKFRVMFNKGSAPLPYEPYGYKIPLTVNGTEYPIYLGEVETTRRVKKLVLTGEENWYASGSWGKENTKVYYVPIADGYNPSNNIVYVVSDHYLGVSRNEIYNSDYECAGFTGDAALTVRVSRQYGGTKENFLAYLAAQYAAGTPVTVWYVLEEPETAIVNEPLMKIGGYADTISFAQAGVTIPTVSGANVLDMSFPIKPSEVYIKGKGIKPTGYGQLVDKNGVRILDKNDVRILVHGQ